MSERVAMCPALNNRVQDVFYEIIKSPKSGLVIRTCEGCKAKIFGERLSSGVNPSEVEMKLTVNGLNDCLNNPNNPQNT